MSSGIYKIENTENNKVYIGRSKNIELRWKQHLEDLKNNTHHSFKLQNDYNIATDKTIFEFNIIEKIISAAKLKKREQYYINFYKAYANGYNSCPFADNPKYVKTASSNTSLLINFRNDMSGNYIKYPREIIEMTNLDVKRMAVFTYLAQHRALDDTVNMTINHLVQKSGYKPNAHTGKINSQISVILDSLESIEYFTLSCGKYVADKFCVLHLNIDKFDKVTGYSCISLKELNLMFTYKSSKNYITFSKLILVLAYIRVNKLRRSENQQSNPKKKPEFFYKQLKQVAWTLV